ncbi:response regulator transcription factor [Bombilactobacillus bombi]|uniref:response regulator transcription factor n=1 Tax=Bombilactobacillus bombi TaxID=1303590 RepID=UPI0015E60E05|nr:response regulator transcription factor [Bombilactobacillus bombi]MBA1434907.1 response regulator transcription factor [Bombilactobacillus bombi]
MIKIILAEDQIMLSSALAAILNLEDDLEVIANCNNGQLAWNCIQQQQPDLALLDIEMPQMNGLQVAQNIYEQHLTTKTIILTTFANKSYFEKAVAAHVKGYLLKDSSSDDLVDAIHQILMGKTLYAPELVQSVLSGAANPLTKQEQNVLVGIAAGWTTTEISQKLFLSNGTVRNYISAILSKLAAKNRIEAVNVAQAQGWL